MFTGIIENVARVKNLKEHLGGEVELTLILQSPFQSPDPLNLGESIAVNGICLTLTAFSQDSLQFFVSKETLRCTALASLKPGDRVNLERSLRADSRLSGHFVQGHVDTTGVITRLQAVTQGTPQTAASYGLTVQFDQKFAAWVAPKGSIAIQGISLTINSISDARGSSDQTTEISIQIVPHTLRHTNLSDARVGDQVNLEFDMMAKYLSRISAAQQANMKDVQPCP